MNKKIQAFKSPLIPLFQRGKFQNLTFAKVLNYFPFFKALNYSPFEKGGKGGFKIPVIISCLFICFAFIGCGTDDPFDSQDSTPVEIPNSLTAIDFPTAEGDSWEYVSGEQSYTAKVSGTKNIGGYTVKIMKTDASAPMDYTGAEYGFPVRNYFFTKDSSTYTEHAFDLWVDFLNDTYFQRYQPKRVIWSFPLYEGKEWTVTSLYTEPKFTYTRKVVSVNESVTVPADTYTNVFHVEESVSIDTQPGVALISTYWLAKGVGVIKYQYADPISLSNVTYELRKFIKG